MRLGRSLQVATYVVLMVVAVELAVWEAFLTASRPFGHPLPVGALVAGLGNLALARAARTQLTASWAPIVPGAIWVVVVIPFCVQRGGEELIVPAGLRGWALLGVGAITAVVGAASPAKKAPAAGATPDGPNGR